MPLRADEKASALSRDLLRSFDNINGGEHAGFRPAHAKEVLLSEAFSEA